MNRAFSRKFFEALGQGRGAPTDPVRAAAVAELEALEASGPMELLDEADLVDLDEDSEDEQLEDADLIEA